MATLHERLIGQNLPESGDKIAIHAFLGAIREYQQGYITGAEFIAMFSLTTGQQTAATVLKDLLNAAPDKTTFLRALKDWLYLGETETDARYLSQANLVTRLQGEVTDQGGTLP